MTQRLVSPGVFNNEVDQSFLATEVEAVGAAIFGLTPTGPAFVPSSINRDTYAKIFGPAQPGYQSLYAAKNYLKNAANARFVKVLGHADGTGVSNGYAVGSIIGIVDSGSAEAGEKPSASSTVLAILHTDVAATGVYVAPVAGDVNRFTVSIQKPIGTELFGVTASFITSSDDYIEKALNTDPTKWSTYYHYLHANYKYQAPTSVTASGWESIEIVSSLSGFNRDYSHGQSSWIKSQKIGGQYYDLFRFHTFTDGKAADDEYKVEISNIRPSPSPNSTPYGTFDVIVRKFYDTDQRREIVDQFYNCSLDPDAKNYVARQIGDSYEAFDTTQRKFIAYGEFDRKSDYVRIEMKTGQNAPAEALPWGFEGYNRETWTSGALTPQLPYVINQINKQGILDPNIRWGVSFVSGGIVDRMRFQPNSIVTANDTNFSLQYLSGTYVNGNIRYSYNTSLAAANYYTPVYASSSLQGFVMPFSGGFDGWDNRIKDPLYLANATTDQGSSGYSAGEGGGHAVVSLMRALDTIRNKDTIDVNLLGICGIHNLKVTDYARALVNDRKDVFYVMDITGSSVAEVVSNLTTRELDDNYTAVYYSDVKIKDNTYNKKVRVAPSVAVLGAIAYSDRVGEVFFAPAGMTRGGISQFDVVDVVDRLTFNDRNNLYDNKINPIATFPGEGIVVFGQKTLQVKESALDRVNVRRLLIFAKTAVAKAAKILLFEPNVPATWQRFTNLVNPILDRVRQDRGINRFKVVMDSTTNTTDVIERNVMKGKIFLEPTKAGEFIDLDFIITNAGVEFGE